MKKLRNGPKAVSYTHLDVYKRQPQNPAALAERVEQGLVTLQSEGHEALRQRCRTRITEHFSLERMVSAYRDLWEATVMPRKMT